VSLLELASSPEGLKTIPPEKLPALAEEIRREILGVVSRNGGHLAASLGVVELTIALHSVFESPLDAIVWDVGHQSYAHKIITGRRGRFGTIRTAGGLSGFTSRAESPHDVFGTGHASTSVSAALGIAEGKRLSGRSGKAVAVLGDGSLTGGLAFEGLNQAGHLEKDLVVVLNDNDMSISPNVGALSEWFSRKFTTDFYKHYRRQIKQWLKRRPSGGTNALMMIRRAIDSSKALLTPGILFEGFNFQYIGPMDGHDIRGMMEIFRAVRDLEGPVVVHVRTCKGRGYPFAEDDPARFHGVGCFDLATGETDGGARTFTRAFGDALLAETDARADVAAITAAMADGTGLLEFQGRHPDRFYDVGIAEEHAVTFAAGLATQGIIPVVAIYSTFLQRGFDQIIHDVALQNLHVVFAVDRAGLVGQDGPTHHGSFDISYARLVPNVKIMAPADEGDLVSMLHAALDAEGPCFIRYPRGAVPGPAVRSPAMRLEIGRGAYAVEAAGRPDVVLIAVGSMVSPAIGAAGLLKSGGISASVINARFVKPLDADLIASAASVAWAAVTVEENALAGGFGSAVMEMLSERGAMPAKFARLGIPDRFIPHGDRRTLLASLGLDQDGIANAARALVTGGPRNV
jgi:1-deoxy-D-xylulose-5-phosphate synthase